MRTNLTVINCSLLVVFVWSANSYAAEAKLSAKAFAGDDGKLDRVQVALFLAHYDKVHLNKLH